MSIPVFLAMTAEELAKANPLPTYCGLMACHYSPGGGLANFPHSLPAGSVILVDDSILPHKQNIDQILYELASCIHRFSARAVILDFQKSGLPENEALVNAAQTLPCPVIVSEMYGKDLRCPILLPPIPPSCLPKEYLAPYAGREIWLEITMETQTLTLTRDGCRTESNLRNDALLPLYDEQLVAHYGVRCCEDAAIFTLRRDWHDLQNLLESTSQHGVTAAIGLYQEFGNIKNPPR